VCISGNTGGGGVSPDVNFGKNMKRGTQKEKKIGKKKAGT
jgi:hypothetical protein